LPAKQVFDIYFIDLPVIRTDIDVQSESVIRDRSVDSLQGGLS